MTQTMSNRRQWLVPTALILLTLIPVAAGADRATQLTTGAPVTPDNARFFASPVPVMVHIVGASLYCVLGALQFVPALRRRRPGWHRLAGRLIVPCGLAAALSGLWMSLFYPRPVDVGNVLEGVRVVFGAAMVAFLVLGFVAVRRRDFGAHRAWMTRAYAIGLGAGTQAVTGIPWLLLVGPFDKLSKVIAMTAAWVLNLAVAEWAIRRGDAGRDAGRGADRRTGRRRIAQAPAV